METWFLVRLGLFFIFSLGRIACQQFTWSEWSGFTPCSASCGGGVKVRTRKCQPLDVNKERNRTKKTAVSDLPCAGPSRQLIGCALQDCPVGSHDTRAKQCSKYNGQIHRGRHYVWEPSYKNMRYCELVCRPRHSALSFAVKLANSVEDGTRCRPADPYHICIQGRCEAVGCDGVLGSGLRFDACGVCGGTNATCHVISGLFTRHSLRYGYNKVATIPSGACNINITEYRPSRNYLALKLAAENGEYLLNGKWALQYGGVYTFAGAKFFYHMPQPAQMLQEQERITSRGPINAAIDIMLLKQTDNKGISYKYTIPISEERRPESEASRVQPWVVEKKPQTGRTQTGAARKSADLHRIQPWSESKADVHRTQPWSQRKEVNRIQPWANEGQQRSSHVPSRSQRTKNRRRHHSRHNMHANNRQYESYYNRLLGNGNLRSQQQGHGAWQEQKEPFKRYDIQSLDGDPPPPLPKNSVPLYRNRPLAPRSDAIHSGRDTYSGNGAIPNRPPGYSPFHSASLREISGTRSLQQPSEVATPRPRLEDTGSSDYSWKVSGFTECSLTCGEGQQNTVIVCAKLGNQAIVTDDNCDLALKPKTETVPCNTKPCPPGWFTGDWGACSTSCNPGQQIRDVTCQQRVSSALQLPLASPLCRAQPRPEYRQRCNDDRPCARWRIGDWSQCSAACGRGQRNREVLCVNHNNHHIPENKCTERESKPLATETCDMGSCAKTWFYTEWSKQCSTTCGTGHLTRDIYCNDNAEKCSRVHPPRRHKPCKNDTPCGGSWFTGPWGMCNVTCGVGLVKRDVVCVRKSGQLIRIVGRENCVTSQRPAEFESCSLPPCASRWYITDWSKCSRSCGTGVQRREVQCLDPDKRVSSLCSHDVRPKHRQTCNTEACPRSNATDRSTDRNIQAHEQQGSQCKNKYRNCHLVVQARLCQYSYYEGICCHSCHLHKLHHPRS